MPENRDLTVEEYGNVEHLEIAIPDHGCLIEVRGRCGSGKSAVLNAAEVAAGGAAKYERRDGSEMAVIRGFGTTATLRRSLRRKGKLEVELVDEPSDIGILVNPRIKSIDAASAKQIKALMRLSGSEVDASKFTGLCPDGHLFLISNDPVAMASEAKRSYGELARKRETVAIAEQAKYDAAVLLAGGLNMEAECDSDTLQAAFEAACQTVADLIARKRQADQECDRQHKAREQFDQIMGAYDGLAQREASDKLSASYARLTLDRDKVTLLERQLEAAKGAVNEQISITNIDERIEAEAREHERVTAELEGMLGAKSVIFPTENEIEEAVAFNTECRCAIEQGALIRDAKIKLADAALCESAAVQASVDARAYRHAASKCDGVLTAAIDCEQLAVKNGHLVAGGESFNRLSEGLRYEIAIEIACSNIPEGQSLLVIPQEEYQATDPEMRQRIRQIAEERNIVILAGIATDGDLRSVVLEAAE